MIDITNIERFATHDGPGIRTTIFFQGCPLRCPWCANPETQGRRPVLFYNKERCVNCQSCAAICPQKAITFEKGEWHYEQEHCLSCGQCVQACLQAALSLQGKSMTITDIMAEVDKDAPYYAHSQGGVTISGGEPFVQAENLLALLQACKEKGYHTAIETTGNTSLTNIQTVLPYVDLFLYDFKHVEDDKLKQVTRGDGTLIKENLCYLLRQPDVTVQVRIPVIPGFNEDALYDMLSWCHKQGVKQVALLPYHSLGKVKYERLGKVYSMPGEMMKEEALQPYQAYGQALGMKVQIGG